MSAKVTPIPLPKKACDAGFMRDVSERAIAVVAIKGVVERQIEIGMAVCAQTFFERAVRILVDLPVTIVDHEEIEQPVVVVVEPASADGPHLLAMCVLSGNACLGGDFGERAVAIVVKKLVARDVGEKNVGVAVIVVIANGDTHAVACAGDACFFGHVSERAVVVVVEEAIPVCGRGLFERGNLGTVNAVDIEEAVVVVVEQGDAGNHGFRLVLVGGSAVAGDEMKTGLLRNLFEVDAGKSGRGRCLHRERHEAARRKRGGGNRANGLDETAALKTRDRVIGHACLRGGWNMTKSIGRRRESCRRYSRMARSQAPHYCYRTIACGIPVGRKETKA